MPQPLEIKIKGIVTVLKLFSRRNMLPICLESINNLLQKRPFSRRTIRILSPSRLAVFFVRGLMNNLLLMQHKICLNVVQNRNLSLCYFLYNIQLNYEVDSSYGSSRL